MITYDLQRFAREQNERITVFPRSRTREAPFQCSCVPFSTKVLPWNGQFAPRPKSPGKRGFWEVPHGLAMARISPRPQRPRPKKQKKKKKTTAALPRVPRWVPYLAPATRHRTSHGRTSTQPRRRHGSPIDRRRPTRQHHLRPGVQYES